MVVMDEWRRMSSRLAIASWVQQSFKLEHRNWTAKCSTVWVLILRVSEEDRRHDLLGLAAAFTR